MSCDAFAPTPPSRPARRRGCLALVAAVLWLSAGWSPLVLAGSPRIETAVRAVGAISMTVSDLDRSVAFYEQVLSFEKVSEAEVDGDAFEHFAGVFGARARVARLKLGDEAIELVEYLAPRGRPIPADSKSNDLWFQHIAIIVSDMDRAYAALRRFKVEHASPSPQTLPAWNENAGGIRAFYFKDPDGHPVEVLWFPPDKGAAKWHSGSDRLFLGIDHTAIAVADTARSLAFYRDVLGFDVAGESFNYGIEQERLNSVFGASLHITGLRAPSGPGIEFLEYLSPRTGRPAPSDLAANDIVHRQTEVVVPDVEGVAGRVGAARAPLVSSGVQHVRALGVEKGIVVRDPDGHAIALLQRIK